MICSFRSYSYFFSFYLLNWTVKKHKKPINPTYLGSFCSFIQQLILLGIHCWRLLCPCFWQAISPVKEAPGDRSLAVSASANQFRTVCPSFSRLHPRNQYGWQPYSTLFIKTLWIHSATSSCWVVGDWGSILISHLSFVSSAAEKSNLRGDEGTWAGCSLLRGWLALPWWWQSAAGVSIPPSTPAHIQAALWERWQWSSPFCAFWGRL